MKKWIMAALTAVIIGTSSVVTPLQAHAQSPVLSAGSRNGDVWDLQYRLKIMNDYKQPLDGVFGFGTLSAVRQYQNQYGLAPDGIVGPLTWKSLHKYTLDKREIDILARIIYSEARGESYEGQAAVGAVVMNRIQSAKFPNTIRGVVFQKGAFTSVSDGQYWLTPDSEAYAAAEDAVRGWDPTHNALYYFNPNTSTSAWIWSRPETVKIGNHIFAK